jgi:hypothetical protein
MHTQSTLTSLLIESSSLRRKSKQFLKKSLTGCKTIVYESKLDAGQRILWTETHRGLIVWYVLKHDDVSRCVRLMDKAESRSNRQLTTSSTLPEIGGQFLPSDDLQAGSSEEVILDPQGDTPLRLYSIRREDIFRLVNMATATFLDQQGATSRRDTGYCLAFGPVRNWVRARHLSLPCCFSLYLQLPKRLLTHLKKFSPLHSKTICICNRIDCDRHHADGVSSFKQLFVARSQRICAMVEEVVGKDTSTTFLTFKRLLLDCETEMPSTTDGVHTTFLPSKKMDFSRFKRDVCQRGSPLDPLLLWTQIRSLIKGSIANLKRRRSREEYMGLGKNECRLTQEQRGSCYSVFETYEKYMNECKLWDDCDRMISVLRQLQSDPNARFAMAYDKVYVDEIQDYSQVSNVIFSLKQDLVFETTIFSKTQSF